MRFRLSEGLLIVALVGALIYLGLAPVVKGIAHAFERTGQIIGDPKSAQD